MDLRVIGLSAALGSAASWAVGSILFKKLGEHLSPLAMTLAKGVVSILLLAFVLFLMSLGGGETTGLTIARVPLLLLVLSGVLGIALGDTFFFEALQDLGPHALVLLGMFGEVLTVVLAIIFLGEKPSLIVWIGIALVVLGISVVLYSKIRTQRESASFRGIVFGLLAVVCMSVSIIIAKEGLQSISAIEATFIRMLSGTTGMLFFGVATRRLGKWMIPFQSVQLVGLFLVSVCLITFGGFWLSLVAIKYVDVAIANTLASTEPLFILPLAAIFLREKISLAAIIGTIMTVAGIVLLCQNA